MTSAFSLNINSTTVEVYDPKELLAHYLELGLEFDSLEDLNYFTYASLPEGSHGKFLVEANKIRGLSDQNIVILTVQGSISSFVHSNLKIANIEYLTVPLTGWALTPGHASHKKMAIITVKDLLFDMDDQIRKDYNRVTTYLPSDTANTTEPVQADLQTFQEILDDIASTYGSGTPTIDLTGVPSIKPHNVLTAGASVPEALGYIADCLCLTAYVDHQTGSGGKIVFTNAPSSSDLVSKKVIYSRYGSDTLPNSLEILFGQQGHPFAKQRTEVLKDYYNNWSSEWAMEDESLTANNDTTLANNSRFTNTNLKASHYYPFYESGLFSQGDANTATIASELATNFVARTQRTQVLLYEDVAQIKPSATVSRVTYRILKNSGMVTYVESTPIKSTNPSLKENLLARGLETVPEMLVGTASLSASNAIGGTAPGDTGLITLEDLGAGQESISYYNATDQQTFENDTISVQFNLHTRRYEFATPIEAIFQYELRTPWTNGVALAYRKNVSTGVTSGKTVIVKDPLRIFTYQSTGSKGYMIHTKANDFIAIQGPCDNSTPPDSSTPVGACCVGTTCYDSITESGCDDIGGAWQGDGVLCSSDPCSE